MHVRPSGIVTLVRLLQLQNASWPMLFTPLPIFKLVRLLQPQNARPPMLVTLSGIVTLFRLLQPWNVESEMSLVPAFIAAFVISFFESKRQRFKYSNPFSQFAGSL